jgi:hypothetical protein
MSAWPRRGLTARSHQPSQRMVRNGLSRWDRGAHRKRGRTPTVLVVCLATLLVGVVVASVVVVWCLISRRLTRPDDPVAALRHNPGIVPLTAGPSALAAARLRPSLAKIGGRVDVRQGSSRLGRGPPS